MKRKRKTLAEALILKDPIAFVKEYARLGVGELRFLMREIARLKKQVEHYKAQERSARRRKRKAGG